MSHQSLASNVSYAVTKFRFSFRKRQLELQFIEGVVGCGADPF